MSPDTRRELISRSILAGGLALATSLHAAEDAAARVEAAVRAEDAAGADALRALFEVERLAEVAYRQVLRSGVLAAGARRAARALLAHEQAHVGVLGAWLRAAGGRRPAPSAMDAPAAANVLAAHHVSGSLQNLRSEHEALRLLIAVEAAAERAYSRAVSRLRDPVRLGVSLEMMACDAQHATVLSELLYPGDVSRAVPGAFVPETR